MKLPASTLPQHVLWGALGLGAYYFYHAAKKFKEESENMKELEFRNVALAMVSQATKMIEHLTSVETDLRAQVATLKADLERRTHDWEQLVKERAENNAAKRENENLTREVESLKKLCDMRTEQVTRLQEKLDSTKSPSKRRRK